MSLRLKEFWLSIPLRRKFGAFSAMLTALMLMFAAFSLGVIYFSLVSVSHIMEDNSLCQNFQSAFETESHAFKEYASLRIPEKEEALEEACRETLRAMEALPTDYARIGSVRAARTWNITNAYSYYGAAMDAFLKKEVTDTDYVNGLYEIYDMQDYIRTYALRLVQETLNAGNADYQRKTDMFSLIPALVLMSTVAALFLALNITKILADAVVYPLLKLAGCSREITGGNFGVPPLQVENRDEIGELVSAFNEMIRVTGAYIKTLKERNEMAARLHREEVLKVEKEKQLAAVRMEALRSQINPHFLYNTLNMIASMARLEDASVTEHMITCMSSLFRYNLETKEQVVALTQELRAVQDYIYIQQMRFGSRIHFEIQLRTAAEGIMIPSFTLQPVVENALVHGILKKENGGRIILRVRRKADRVFICIADTGVGISAQKRQALERSLKEEDAHEAGIGLGNLYKRLHYLYKGGTLKIYSCTKAGTVVYMCIPQDETCVTATKKQEE